MRYIERFEKANCIVENDHDAIKVKMPEGELIVSNYAVSAKKGDVQIDITDLDIIDAINQYFIDSGNHCIFRNLKMMFEQRKSEYKKKLLAEVKDDICNDALTECIYIIDDVRISANMEDGIRSNDHRMLKLDGYTWDDVASFGTIITIETRTYISDVNNAELDAAGFTKQTTL